MKYFVLISFGMLIFPFFPGKFRSDNKFGLSPANVEWI